MKKRMKKTPVGVYKDMNDNMITINVDFVQKGTLWHMMMVEVIYREGRGGSFMFWLSSQ